ncbi:Protein-lysine methyltransferase METTL21E [Bienertia sinuspersici]
MAQAREIQVGMENSPLYIHEHHDVCDPITGRVMTGSWVWDSALILSHYITTRAYHEHDFSLQGKTVLELGAGLGLPGLTASKLGARRVILTDLGPLLQGLRHNVDANRLSDRVEVCELVWGTNELPNQLKGSKGGVDVVLMSDVLYDPSLMGPLAKTLNMVCGSETLIWSASEVRDSTSECLCQLTSHGFEVTELPKQFIQHSLCDMETSNNNHIDNFGVYLIRPLKQMCSP